MPGKLFFARRNNYSIPFHHASVSSKSLRFSMFLANPAGSELSICLRCQYRSAVRQRNRQRRPIPIPVLSVLPAYRLITLGAQPQQQQQRVAQHEVRNHGDEHVIPSRKASRKLSRRVHIYPKDSVSIASLGKPGEVLLLQQTGTIEKKDSIFQMEEATGNDPDPDNLQMMHRIDDERGRIEPERVTQNLETLKATCLQGRSGKVTASRYKKLAKTMHDGFTRSQLCDYLANSSSTSIPVQQADHLSNPHFTNLYTRSSWRSGSTFFPGDSSARLAALRKRLRGSSSQVQSIQNELINKNASKRLIVDHILRQRWGLVAKEELHSSGELDIEISKAYLNVILSHSKKYTTV